jgi:biofilm PGA synthesis protein PgaA
VSIHKKDGGTVAAGRNEALAGSLPRNLARVVGVARGWPPIVCALALGMQGMSQAHADAEARATTPPAADRGAAAYDAQQHDTLIVARRTGRITPAEALQQLSAWLAAPLDDAQRRRVASDAVSIAAGDGRFAEAVALGRRFPPAQLLDHALAPLTVAARRTHEFALQGETIAVWRARQPASRDARIHEAFWHLDSGDVAGAQALYRALSQPAPVAAADRIALLELRGAVARAGGDTLQALAAYTESSALQPGRADARREADLVLAASGAASTAFDDAQAAERAHPGTFSALSLSTLQQQALAQRLRWAIQERDERAGLERVGSLDRVLADQEAALGRLDMAAASAAPADAPAWHTVRVRLQADRLLALVERGRPADALALYDTLRATGTELPPSGLAAAAGAFAQERRSADAVPLYEAALAKAGADLPMPDAIHFELVYAYQDTGRFEDAEALLKRIEDATPAFVRLAPQARRPNTQYTDVSGMRSLLALYENRTALAEERFATLTQEAPLNAGFAQGAAQTERLRDHPEAALARFEALATNQPFDLGARAGHVEALMDAGEFAQARRRAEALQADAPDAVAVRGLARRRRAVLGPQLEIESAGSTGGATLADREWRLDSRLSSGLIDDQWRVFYDQSLGRGDTALGDANRARGGLGLNWQRGRWLAEGEVQRSNTGPYRTSVAGRVDYRAGDAWRLSATYDGDSKDLPWKAQLAGTGARAAGASVGYVVDESRRFDLKWKQLDFSDGNLRNGLDFSWSERWIATPRFQLETRLGVDASRGRAQDVPYFNPSSDASAQLSVRAQWLNWKRDDRQFFQAVELGGGGYRQAGFGTGALWSLRYEHRWNLGPKLALRYGVSISGHPYDGVRERQRGVFLNLSTPLQ